MTYTPFWINRQLRAFEHAYGAFLEQFPGYANCAEGVDRLRATEYARYNELVYLDYTGSSLYGKSQLEQHFKLLEETPLANPHSINQPSQRATELINLACTDVFKFFKVSEKDYTLIWTSNASGALRVLALSYPFRSGQVVVMTSDNHNSVGGLAYAAMKKGCKVLLVDTEEQILYALQKDKDKGGLFCFPYQSNATGVQYDPSLVTIAQALGWVVVADVAAYVPTNVMNLSKGRPQPDALPISFYKMFGHPTGVGCLLVRNALLGMLRSTLHSTGYSGGTVDLVSPEARWFIPAAGSAAF